MHQLYFGQMDMELHSAYNPKNTEGETIFDVQCQVAEVYSPHLLPMEWDRFLCAFSHIFAGGYSAGYYSYIWAEVMSADAFGQNRAVQGCEGAKRGNVNTRYAWAGKFTLIVRRPKRAGTARTAGTERREHRREMRIGRSQ